MLKKMWQDIKQCGPGSFEVCLFMVKGINRFSDDWGQMWRSFTLTVIMILTAYYMALSHAPLVTEAVSPNLMFGISTMTMLLSMAVNLLILFLFAKFSDITHLFPKMVTVSNWTALPISLIHIFIKTLENLNVIDFKASEDINIVMFFYSVAVTAYLIARTLKIDWTLGAFFAVLGFIVSQTILNGFYTIFDIPAVDYEVYFSDEIS